MFKKSSACCIPDVIASLVEQADLSSPVLGPTISNKAREGLPQEHRDRQPELP
jgi:hypothetical protein